MTIPKPLIGILSAAVVGGSIAYVATPASALAGFGGGTTTLISASMQRRSAVTVTCAGECLVRSAENDDSRLCPLRPGLQASYAACLTALNGLCTSACKTTP